MKFKIVLIIFIFIPNIFAQSKEKLSPYVKDFLYVCEKLESVHPNIYENMSIAEYAQWRTACKKEAELVKNNMEMQLLIAKFLAKFKDSHTQVSFGDNRHFPLWIHFFNGKYYLVGTEDIDSIGYAIVSINNIPIEQVVEKLGQYISAENDDCRKFYLNTRLHSPNFLSIINNGIIPDSISFTMDNGKTIHLKATKKSSVSLDSAYIDIYTRNRDNFSYQIDTAKNTCFFYFNSMIDRAFMCKKRKLLSHKKYANIPLFSEFLSNMFQDIKKHNIQNLIVDLRYNYGGDSRLGDQLLYFIANKDEVSKLTMSVPARISKDYKKQRDDIKKDIIEGNTFFEEWEETNDFWYEDFENPQSAWYIKDTSLHFYGNTYFLTSQSTYSAGSDLAWFAACLGFPLYGEVTAQTINTFGDILEFSTPYSKIYFYISCKYFYDKNATPDNRVHPTIEIPYDYKDIRCGQDKPMEKVLEIIKNNNK